MDNTIKLELAANNDFYETKMTVKQIKLLSKKVYNSLKNFCKKHEIVDIENEVFKVNFYINSKINVEIETLEIYGACGQGVILEYFSIETLIFIKNN